MAEGVLQAAKNLAPELTAHRRYLHSVPELGFDLTQTLAYVSGKLSEMGVEHKPCGKAGIVACIGGKKPGKVFLLRADMDALPMAEESGDEFAATNGRMHACGHDMHTAILLGAAKLLKEREDEIEGTVKLMFQPAEEIMEGAADMLAGGVLENPKVNAGMMFHVMTGMPMPAGMMIVSAPGVSATASDFFTIKIKGKGCHGAAPNQGIDPLLAGAHILVTLQEIHARELAMNDQAILTVGTFHAGKAANAIADTAEITGTIRTLDENTRAQVNQRLEQIVAGVGMALRVETEVLYNTRCPSLYNDKEVVDSVTAYSRELLGEQMVLSMEQLLAQMGGDNSTKIAGSEDFAYISRQIPIVMVALAAGEPGKGYQYPQHHPKVRFDEDALPYGSAVYAHCAMRWLGEHK